MIKSNAQEKDSNGKKSMRVTVPDLLLASFQPFFVWRMKMPFISTLGEGIRVSTCGNMVISNGDRMRVRENGTCMLCPLCVSCVVLRS